MSQISKPDSGIELHVDAATAKIIDVNDGIDRLMGDRVLYVRMLARFRADYKNNIGPIKAALEADDGTLAHRIAHTLKGASGMIGAHPLHWQACSVERALRTGAATQLRELEALEPILAEVLSALDAILASVTTTKLPEPSKPAPSLSDAALLARLTSLLENGDGAAIDLLDNAGAALSKMLGKTVMHNVTVAAQEFDYEAALAALADAV